MSGSHVAVIVMPIVIAICLAFWISLVYYATAHPKWSVRWFFGLWCLDEDGAPRRVRRPEAVVARAGGRDD